MSDFGQPRGTFDLVKSPLPEDTADPVAIRSDGDGGAWVEQLEQPPGPQLLAELVECFPASLGDLDLALTLAAWERMEAFVAARHAEALAALLARADRFGGVNETAAILATEVGCTQSQAKTKLAWAHTLGIFTDVAHALEVGAVDVAKARAICDEALTAPKESAHEVAALGLALAPQKTPPQLRRALRAAVIGLDPGAAQKRLEAAKADRRVEFRALPDAMAAITAFLPATDAMAVKTALDALARTTGSEDPRSFDQRRADYLSAIFHAICDAGEAPLHPDHAHGANSEVPTSTRTPGGSDTRGGLHTAAGAGEAGSTAGGSGEARSAAGGSGEARSAAGGSGEAGEERAAGGASAAGGAGKAGRPADFGGTSTVDAGRASNSPVRNLPIWRRLATNQRQRPHLQVTVAASTLLGIDERPGELTGYGPIPADVARLVATDATWRALYTDRSGAVSAVGDSRYRPGAVLARHVAARDRTCTFTGCSRPAVQCDIDHREAFTSDRPAAEQTHLGNLHALCRFHHNLKTLHGWSPTHDPQTGVTTWSSPLGTRHDREPELPLPPWESWLDDLAQGIPPSPCMCVGSLVLCQAPPGNAHQTRHGETHLARTSDPCGAHPGGTQYARPNYPREAHPGGTHHAPTGPEPPPPF